MLSVMVLLIVAFVTYAWVVRGFFSALVHLACTVVAGAVALGAWEPLSLWVMSLAPDRGFLSFLRDSAWAIGLAAPFAIALALLRFGTNAILPANARCEDTLDYVGGGVCGLASGVLTAGFFLLSLGYMRFAPDAMGYQPVRYTMQSEGRGSIEREPGFLVGMTPRVDLITARFYEFLSRTTLRTGEPLAKWYPDFDAAPWANRMTYLSAGRNSVRPDDFSVLGWYTVGLTPQDANPSGGRFTGGPLAPLMTDLWDEQRQVSLDLNGKRVDRGYLAGFKVRLKSGAKEKQGQILVGAGQVRLVVESVEAEEFKTLHPVAVVTNMGIEGLPPDTPAASARFRYNGNDVFFASVGGAADAGMWFEFAIPSGFRPIGLYIKNVRWEVPEAPPQQTFATPAERDATIVAMGGVLPRTEDPLAGSGDGSGVTVSNAIGWSIQRGSHGSLEIQRDGRWSYVVDGEETFDARELRESARGLDRSLLIDRFTVTPDTVVVRLDVSMRSPASLLSREADNANPDEPLVLVDTNGQAYEAIGYIYSDAERMKLRYTAGRPLRGINDLTRSGVTLSRSRPEQKLELIFRPTFGVKIAAFRIGGQVVKRFDEPIALTVPQR